MKHLRQYIRQILLEDAFGFAKEAGTLQRSGELQGEPNPGEPIDRPSRREIKDLFRKHADHQWLSSLVTVHWVSDEEDLEGLVGRGKDELSTMITLPGQQLQWGNYGSVGLWVQGHITLAANSMDDIHSGHQRDYVPAPSDHWSYRDNPTEEEYEQQKKSSGINKQPKVWQKYSQYANMSDNEKHRGIFKKNYLPKFPYILDEETWESPGTYPNEALVDNWTPKAIVLTDGDRVERYKEMLASEYESERDRTLTLGVFPIASRFNVPVIDGNFNPIWSPGE